MKKIAENLTFAVIRLYVLPTCLSAALTLGAQTPVTIPTGPPDTAPELSFTSESENASFVPLPDVLLWQQNEPVRLEAGSTRKGLGEVSRTVWSFAGPAPLTNGQTMGRVDPVSGRVTAIAVHPANSNIVYVGTANGGVYRSLNGGTNWTPILDAALSLAIGAIAIDPVSPSTVFVGTGEANYSGDSYFGVGLYRIVNADTTPILQGPFESRNNGGNGHAFYGGSISKIIVDPNNHNNLFVGCTWGFSGTAGAAFYCCNTTTPISPSIGLYFCTNAQAVTPTFARVTSLPGGGLAGVDSMVIEPGNANNLIISIVDIGSGSPSTGTYHSTNALLGASAIYTRTLNFSATQTRTKLAIHKIDSAITVLAASALNNGTLYRSTDGGDTWPETLTAANGFGGGQVWYNTIIAMDPGNANIIYIGGKDRQLSPPSRTFAKSMDGGLTFTNLDIGLHADSHALALDPSNPDTLYFGSDGGIWKSTDGATNWFTLNNEEFSATQFTSLALHPRDPLFTIGGTQDNGTEWLRPDGTWKRIDSGDGGFTVIDRNTLDTTNVLMYHTFQNVSGSMIGLARLMGANVANAKDTGWKRLGYSSNSNFTFTPNGIGGSDTVLFYAPMVGGPGNPNTLYFGTDRLYRSTDRGDTMTVVSQAPFVAGIPVSAIGISPQNDNVRIVGLKNGKVYATTTGSNPLTDVTGGWPAVLVSRAVIDPNQPNTAYISLIGYGLPLGQHVLKTSNLSGGAGTWTVAGNGIPDVPVNALVIDPRNSKHIYAGTDWGVYYSTNAGTSWAVYGSGLPRLAVWDIAIQESHGILRAATHGRGVWQILTAQDFPKLFVSGTSISGGNGNGRIEANECNFLTVGITNAGGTSWSNVTATLSTTTPGVTIAQPVSAYPDLMAGASFSNSSPFVVSSAMPCGTPITFVLVLNFTGGAATNTFTLPTCDCGPTVITSSLAVDDPQQTGRLGRDGLFSGCGIPKIFPGIFVADGSRSYHSHTLPNISPNVACVSVSISSPCDNNLFVVSYLGDFNPGDLTQGYLSDIALSPPFATNFIFNVPGQTNFTIVVHTIDPGSTCSGYALSISGLACSTNGSGVCVPQLIASPSGHDFGMLAVGATASQTFTVTNAGLGILNGTATADPPFAVTLGNPFSISPGQTKSVTVTFTPTNSAVFVSSVIFLSDGGNSTNAVSGVAAFAPVADFTAIPVSGLHPLLVSFTDTSSGDVTNWFWNFGDGSTSTEANPSHTYSETGIFSVMHTVTGPSGVDSLTRPNLIAVTNLLPTIVAPAITGDDFTFTFETIAGKTYVIEFKDALDDAAWQTLQSVPGDGSVKTITNSISAASQRFFRLNVQ